MFVFPKLVEERRSKFNGLIKVYKQFGQYSISVDNLTQSGGLLTPIWRRTLKKVNNEQETISNVLILGLGGGSSAQLVKHFWPEAKITAIEIDPAMIELGKKYMDLDKIKNLKIIVGNAFKLIHDLRSTTYDLVLVDTYLGKSYPQEAKSAKFFSRLKKLLTFKGVVIFNRLNWERNDDDIRQHISLLKKHFPYVTHRGILSNTLVFCSPSR